MRGKALAVAGCMVGFAACVGDDGPIPQVDSGVDAASDVNVGPDVTSPDAGDGGVDAGPCNGMSGCPAEVDPTHLQLWLRGDVGLDCPSHRVTTWHDQSTHGRNAGPTTTTDGGAVLAAQCNEHAINSLSVVTFTAPTPSPNIYQDETLQVDLGFLPGAEFTIAIVHKQAAYTLTGGLLSFGNLPPIAHCGSSQGVQNTGLLELVVAHDDTSGSNEVYRVSHDCAGLDTAFPSTASLTPVLMEYTFDNVAGMRFFLNGIEVTNGMASKTGVTQDGGASTSLIGRGSNEQTINTTTTTVDTRYNGDIAEIVAYDLALSEPDRQTLEGYLKTKWGL
jgi:hypothetical protein